MPYKDLGIPTPEYTHDRGLDRSHDDVQCSADQAKCRLPYHSEHAVRSSPSTGVAHHVELNISRASNHESVPKTSTLWQWTVALAACVEAVLHKT